MRTSNCGLRAKTLSISPNLEVRDLGSELNVFQMQRPAISLPRSRIKKTTST